LLFWKQKKKKELFAQRPLEEVFSSQIGPWPDFGAEEVADGRRRGARWGKPRGEREGPRGELGWGWGDRSGRRRGEQRAAGVASGGGDRPAVVRDGEWVGEHRWMSMKLFAGFVGREEGWRRELRGSLGGGGGHGGGGGRSRRKGARGAGLSSSGGEKGGRGRL